MNLIVDVETTGLPLNYRGIYTDLKCYDTARVVQLSFIYTDFKDKYTEYNYVIKRDNFNIKNSHIHGITNEISDSIGVDIKTALMSFVELARDSIIYAHNAKFDIPIIQSELYRLNMPIPNWNVVCTMLKYSKIGQKYVKLTELYYEKTGKKIDQDHNAINDCKILYEILILSH